MIGSIDRAKLRRILAIPEPCEIHLVLALGYPAETVVLEPIPQSGDTAGGMPRACTLYRSVR